MTDFFAGDLNTIFVRLALAVLAGGLIGLERAFHGRPAGFRSHRHRAYPVDSVYFGIVERRLPTQRYAHMYISTQADSGLERDDIMTTVMAHDIKCAAPGYHLEDMGKIMHYEFTLRSINSGNFKLLAETLRKHEKIAEHSVILPLVSNVYLPALLTK